MSVETLVEHFSALEDPRCASKIEHRLIDILVIAVCAQGSRMKVYDPTRRTAWKEPRPAKPRFDRPMSSWSERITV